MSTPPSAHAHPRPVHGWRPPPRPHTGLRATFPGSHSEVLSAPDAAVDLEQHAPRIQDQGPLGSCVGQSTARAIAIALHRQQLVPGFVALGASLTDPADDARGPFLPSPLDLYRGARAAIGTLDEDSGALIGDALKYAKEQGFGPDSLWPHEQNRGGFNLPPPDALVRARPHHRLISYEPLDYDLDTIRWELTCGFAVCVGLRVYAGIFDAPGGVIPLPEGSARGGHAMCLTGFDNGRGAFRCDQSWSESWGEQGRGWLPFDYVLNPLWCGEIYAVRVVRKG